MNTPASIRNHPIHPMLIALPVTFFVLGPILDGVHLGTRDPFWGRVAFWDVSAAIVTALIAAIPGFVDYRSLRGPAARIGTYHMILNLSAVALFAASLIVRGGSAQAYLDNPGWGPFVLTLLGALTVGVSGWLGGEMVYRHRVAVEEDVSADVARVRGRRVA
jgi:uncharacterized membrane protein